MPDLSAASAHATPACMHCQQWSKIRVAGLREAIQQRRHDPPRQHHKQTGHQILFIDTSMGLQKGEKVGLIGPNGPGKATLFRMIAGQEPPDDGQVTIDPSTIIGYFSHDVGEMSGVSAVAAATDGVGPVSALAVVDTRKSPSLTISRSDA